MSAREAVIIAPIDHIWSVRKDVEDVCTHDDWQDHR
jgi:hypothetical protein